MIDLDEMHFELLESEDSESGVPFGIGLPVSVDDEGFDPGSLEWAVQDSVNPIRGHTQFGRDVTTAPMWAWSLHVDTEDTEQALSALGQLAAAWRGPKVARRAGAVTPLRYRIGGRDRRVYGRPRRFSAPPSNRIMSGYVPITADFQCVDDLHYADILSSTTFSAFTGGSEGGFILPAVLPLSTLPSGLAASDVYVGGDVPTYGVYRFDGPHTNPLLICDDWELTLNLTIGDNDWVEIDTRPWHLTATRKDGRSVVGALGPRQSLLDMTLKPGKTGFTLRSQSTVGAGTCTITWRDAYASL